MITLISNRETELTDMLRKTGEALDACRAERDALKKNYADLAEVADMMIQGAANMLDIARDADRLAAENKVLRDAWSAEPAYYLDDVGIHYTPSRAKFLRLDLSILTPLYTRSKS